MDCHILMKNNSMFLLDLASSTGEEPVRVEGAAGLATVAELTPADPGAFPYTQFHCLEALGVQDSQLKELNDELILEESWRKGATGSNWEGGGESRSSSDTLKSDLLLVDMDADKADANPEGGEIAPPEEFQGREGGAVLRRNRFHRSVSIGSPRGKEWSPAPAGRTVLTNRKRNSSYEDSGERGSTAEFLAHTSPAWKRLFEGGHMTAKLLDSPCMQFLLSVNDLDSLQVAMQISLRKAVCRSFAMQAFTWLIRGASQPVCLHDLLWNLISAMQQPAVSVAKDSNKNTTKKEKDEANVDIKDEQDIATANKEREEGFEHPMSDLSLVGGAVQSLPSTFHTLLQTISDLMILLPLGSALQQAAVSIFALRFWPSDHPFLHQSHLFSTISKILSRGEGEVDPEVSPRLGQVEGGVETWSDLTAQVEVTVSSRQAMLPSLTDSSTETFWESGDEDRNKTKWVAVKLPGQAQPRSLAVHIDNGRDIGNKVGTLTFKTGRSSDDMVVVKSLEVDSRFAGWVTCFLGEVGCGVVRVEIKGPDNTDEEEEETDEEDTEDDEDTEEWYRNYMSQRASAAQEGDDDPKGISDDSMGKDLAEDDDSKRILDDSQRQDLTEDEISAVAQSSSLKIVDKALELPIINEAVEKAMPIFNDAVETATKLHKEAATFPYVNKVETIIVDLINKAETAITPYVSSRLTRTVARLDNIACTGLDQVTAKVPTLTQPTGLLYTTTVNLANTIVDFLFTFIAVKCLIAFTIALLGFVINVMETCIGLTEAVSFAKPVLVQLRAFKSMLEAVMKRNGAEVTPAEELDDTKVIPSPTEATPAESEVTPG